MRDYCVFEIDLQIIDTQFETICNLCQRLAPYHDLFLTTKIKSIHVDMSGRYGFIRITPILLKKLRLIYDFVTEIERNINCNRSEIVDRISAVPSGIEQLEFIHALSGLIWTFRREYFNDVLSLLELCSSQDMARCYFFDYEQAMTEPDLSQQIKMLAADREELRANGVELYAEIDFLIDKADKVFF